MRRCEILRGGMEQYMTPMGPTKLHVMPLFEIGPLEPRFSEWLVFEGAPIVTLHNNTHGTRSAIWSRQKFPQICIKHVAHLECCSIELAAPRAILQRTTYQTLIVDLMESQGIRLMAVTCLVQGWLCCAGISVDETGKQHYLDATIAFKRAVLNCIDYLSKFGYTKRQARHAILQEPCAHMQLGRLKGR